jgi:hypothetical protein
VSLMKAKLKISVATFVATTGFWGLAIFVFFWCLPDRSDVNFIEDAQRRGFYAMMSARNSESQPMSFTVAELRTNATSADTPQAILLERQLPPAGELWIGIKKAKMENK